MPLLLKVCKHCAGTMGNKWLTITKFTETRKCKSTATTNAVLNQHTTARAERLFVSKENLCNHSKASSVLFTCRQRCREECALLFQFSYPPLTLV